MRRSFCAPPLRSLACHRPPNRTEHLLIHRIQSHTNPKRRKGFLKQAGQKSVKEELPKQRKGPKRAVEYQLKVQTHIWEQDAGSSSLPTRTTSPWSTSSKGRFSLFFGVEFDSYYKYFFTFPQRFISSPNPQLLHTPALQFEHISDCCFRNLAKLSDSHASRKVCCFKSTEKVSSSIPKEQGIP